MKNNAIIEKKISFSITQCLLRIARSSRVSPPCARIHARSGYPLAHEIQRVHRLSLSLSLRYTFHVVSSVCSLRRCIRIRVLGYDRE